MLLKAKWQEIMKSPYDKNKASWAQKNCFPTESLNKDIDIKSKQEKSKLLSSLLSFWATWTPAALLSVFPRLELRGEPQQRGHRHSASVAQVVASGDWGASFRLLRFVWLGWFIDGLVVFVIFGGGFGLAVCWLFWCFLLVVLVVGLFHCFLFSFACFGLGCLFSHCFC